MLNCAAEDSDQLPPERQHITGISTEQTEPRDVGNPITGKASARHSNTEDQSLDAARPKAKTAKEKKANHCGEGKRMVAQ